MTTNVLILCTHNSARSVLAEGMFNHFAALYSRDMLALSAGSAPSGHINPFALEDLNNAGVERWLSDDNLSAGGQVKSLTECRG